MVVVLTFSCLENFYEVIIYLHPTVSRVQLTHMQFISWWEQCNKIKLSLSLFFLFSWQAVEDALLLNVFEASDMSMMGELF